MNELPRLLLLLALAGAATTFLGSLAIWWLDETRRIRRALTRVLKAPPEAVIVASGRGRGAGFSFASGLFAVAWDAGAWCLVYRVEELLGAELLVDGQVIARAARGEPRRALDKVEQVAAQVTLRLLFDDPRYPDFTLDLYLAGDELRRQPLLPKDAIQEGNRWLARTEAILRRPAAPRGPAPAPLAAARETAGSPAVARPITPPAPPPAFDDADDDYDDHDHEDDGAPVTPPALVAALQPAPQAESRTPLPPLNIDPPPWDQGPAPPKAKKKRGEADDDQDELPF